jgi:PAS domain S-box-containing protein
MSNSEEDIRQLLISEREIRIKAEAELKKAERRISDLEAKFSTALKASQILKDNSLLANVSGRNKDISGYDFDGDGIWHLDIKNRIASFSPGFSRKFGIERQELTSVLEDLRKIAERGTESVIVSLLDNSEHKEDSIQSTCRFRTVDGDYRWVLEKAQIIERDPQGEPVLILGETIDITYQKEIEEQFKVMAQRFSGLLENIQMGVLVEDENRRIALVNPHFCQLFQLQYSPESLIGLSCSASAEEMSVLFADKENFISRINYLLEKRKLFVNEELSLIDGRWFERDFIPIFIHDEYRGNLWKYRDITERKQQETKLRIREEKYRSIIENMNLGILEVDKQEIIQYANQSFCAMSGYALSELLNKNAASIFSAGENNNLLSEKVALRTKGVSDAYEMNVTDKNGVEKWWLISGAPRYNDDGELVGSIGIHLDITQQKLLQAQLIEEKNRADQSVAARDSFIANMSHEIRTPMNAIIGLGSILAKSTLSAEQFKYLSHINNSARNLLVVLNDVLDYSKLEAGKLTIEKTNFQLRETVEKSCNILGFKAEEKGLALFFNFDPRISDFVQGDPMRLNQIMMNLVGNAIKFTEEGSVTIQCSLLRNEQENQIIRISVSDTGIGMDDGYLNRIFEKFTQEDERISKLYGGTGLGMTITLELVKLMDGHLFITSKKGSGTQVTLEFSFEKATELSKPQNQLAEIPTACLKGINVLLVEDNPTNRIVATSMMEPYGIIVTEAENGYEALDKLRSFTPDLILMDVQMPGIDGLETTQQIRKKIGLELPIIALTANVLLPMQVKCRESGMNDFLGKPYDEGELISKIATMLKLPEVCNPQSEFYQENSCNQAVSTKVEIETFTAPLFNLTKLEKLSRGDDDFMSRMLGIFMREVPVTVQKLNDAIKRNDLLEVKALAHRLKPSINDMGISSLKEIIQETEEAAEEGNSTIPLRNIPIIQHTVDEVMNQLRKRSA